MPTLRSSIAVCDKNQGREQLFTRLLRQMTGHIEQPSVQQQHKQPQTSHFMLSGNVLRNTLLIRFIDAANSSGATCSRSSTSVTAKLNKPI